MTVTIDNIRPMDWKLISATCHHPCFAPHIRVMASGFAVGDYLSIVRDLCDAEELKIKSSYSSSLKDTIKKLCSGKR